MRAISQRLESQHVRQLSGAGIMDIDVRVRPEGTRVTIRQKAANRVRSVEHGELDPLLDALGIGSGDLDAPLPN